ncbi:MAG: LysM peptidoglycan-binding domain-containing protein [Clostridium sp.]
MKAMPGIVGYFVQPQDSLWDVAKHFHTTEDSILASNELPGGEIKAGRLPDPGKGNWMSFRKNKKRTDTKENRPA